MIGRDLKRKAREAVAPQTLLHPSDRIRWMCGGKGVSLAAAYCSWMQGFVAVGQFHPLMRIPLKGAQMSESWVEQWAG